MNAKTSLPLRPKPFKTFFQKKKEGHETVSLRYDLSTPIKKQLFLLLKSNCLVYLKESLWTSSAEKLSKKYEKLRQPNLLQSKSKIMTQYDSIFHFEVGECLLKSLVGILLQSSEGILN